MRGNWRRDIRTANQPTISLTRPDTPPLLKCLSRRARNLKQKRFYQDSQIDWIKYYNKLINEYHKIEHEINALDLIMDSQYNLHSEINQYRQEYLQWKQSISNLLSTVYSSDYITRDSLQNIKNELQQNKYYEYPISVCFYECIFILFLYNF